MNDKKKNIVLVEDDDVIREVYETVLTAEGFRVVTASTGKEGLKLVAGQQPDVILLDMLMPDLNGVDFLQQYGPKNHPEVKIIVFSNLMDTSAMQTVLDLGAEKYLLKADFTPTKIAQLLKNL